VEEEEEEKGRKTELKAKADINFFADVEQGVSEYK